MANLTHRDLCFLAGRWLRRRGCTVVLVDAQTSRTVEQPDAIGWRLGWRSILIEVKVSRSDFFRDADKVARRAGGYLGQERFYLTPRGLVTPAEVPAGWGLVEAWGERVHTIVPAPALEPSAPCVMRSELCLLVAQLERVQAGRETHLLPASGRRPVSGRELLDALATLSPGTFADDPAEP